ncbi:MAG: ATP-binding protein [Bacteroidetes bacterium]|nr:ATP-binding protein [Bacteroidota bacterium]
MAKIINPFPVIAYSGSEFFCNRKAEIKTLKSNIENGVNTTLISIRRMGKTGLILHLFSKLSRNAQMRCLYVDMYATQNQKDLIERIASAVLKEFPAKKPIGKKIFDFITGLRPIISYDNLTGLPQVSFNYSQPLQQEKSLEQLFQFLDKLGITIVIALDEFQQINMYPEKNTEALLRTIFQRLNTIRFIYSGSSKHILSQMFTQKARPFFASTQMLNLNEISEVDYSNFIQEKFNQHSRKISEEALQFIIHWTKLHTYYTQVVCNRIFASGFTFTDIDDVRNICYNLLEEHKPTFIQYKNLLTPAQWKLLTAIAKEEKLYQPGGAVFISKYKLGTPSKVQRSLQALLSKEMLYTENDSIGNYYSVYDCFLARWLERN